MLDKIITWHIKAKEIVGTYLEDEGNRELVLGIVWLLALLWYVYVISLGMGWFIVLGFTYVYCEVMYMSYQYLHNKRVKMLDDAMVEKLRGWF